MSSGTNHQKYTSVDVIIVMIRYMLNLKYSNNEYYFHYVQSDIYSYSCSTMSARMNNTLPIYTIIIVSMTESDPNWIKIYCILFVWGKLPTSASSGVRTINKCTSADFVAAMIGYRLKLIYWRPKVYLYQIFVVFRKSSSVSVNNSQTWHIFGNILLSAF